MNVAINHTILRDLGQVADSSGYEIYVVGGFVRDLILERSTKDIDISVVGDGIEFAGIASEKLGGGKVLTFRKYGTAMLRIRSSEFEFVGTRTETYESGSRKPTVHTGTIQDDLRRRDFTVNAMAVSLNNDRFGSMLDPYAGLEDLRGGILRTPLDPVTTLSEDPLRMMRAFRFAAQLGFTIDDDVVDAVRELHDRIGIVSTERIRDEFLKILESPKPSVGLAPMQDTGLLKEFFPEFHDLAGVDQRSVEYPGGSKNYQHKDVFHHTLQVLDNLATKSDDLWLRMSAVLHDIAKPHTKAFNPGTGWTFHGHPELGARMVRKIFRDLKLPLDPVRFVARMVALHLRPISLVSEGVSESALRRLLFEAGEDIDSLMKLCRADITSKNPRLVKRYMRNYRILLEKLSAVEEKDRLRNWQPPLRGEEIMEQCGIKPGIAVGVLKSRIENAILEGIIPNERSAALEYLLSIKDEVLHSNKHKKPVSLKQTLTGLPDDLKN